MLSIAMIDVTCVHCGRLFSTWPSKVRGTKGRFCGQTCFFASLRAPRSVKTCPACGGTFTVLASQSDKRTFCSRSCGAHTNGALRRTRVEKVCEVCGEAFSVIAAKAGARYCSTACMGQAWRRGEEKTCPHCGARFWASPSKSWRIYCSLSCSSRAHPDLPQRARRRVTRHCQRCGAAFAVIPSQTWIAYCSTPCRLAAKRDQGLVYGQTLHKPAERLWDRLDRSGGPDACWPHRRPGERGYATINVEGKERLAHRVAWELVNGLIPPGLFVLHRCPGRHNRAGCIPAHLYVGTRRDNARDLKRQYEEGHLARPPRDAAGHPLKRRDPVAQVLYELYKPVRGPE